MSRVRRLHEAVWQGDVAAAATLLEEDRALANARRKTDSARAGRSRPPR